MLDEEGQKVSVRVIIKQIIAHIHQNIFVTKSPFAIWLIACSPV
jgi:hypothetical protein